MFGFFKSPHDGTDSSLFSPVAFNDSDEVLRVRVGQLTGDEWEIYKWLRECYSERWIAETLLLNRMETKQKISRVFFKLGVKNKRAFIRTYGRLERPHEGLVDTSAIDSYVDARMEKEIQNHINETTEGGQEHDK